MTPLQIDRRLLRMLLVGLLAGCTAGVGACGGEDAPRDDAELEQRYGRRDSATTPADSPRASDRADSQARRDDPATPAPATPPTVRPDVGSTDEPAEEQPGPERPVQDASAGDVDPTWLLARADEAYEGLSSLQASFRQVVEIALLGRRREGTGTWYQKGRDLFRMDFAQPPEDEIVADGTYLWLYTPSDTPGQVIRSTIEGSQTEADALAALLAEARSRYQAEYAGREAVGGVQAHRIRLAPAAGASYREVELWIGDRDHLVRRFRIVEENETVRTVTLTDLRPGAAIRDEIFRFTPPEGVEVFSG